MRLSAAVLATTLLATAAGAREVGFPLLVDHALLRASLARQLGEERDGSALVWGTRGSCRSLVLSDLRVGPAPGRVRITAQVTAHLGFRFLGFCFAPLSWKGNVESVARPEDATPSPPEPPLAPIEVARWQQLLESWDGFLVFVVKNLGVADADPRLRDELLDLLLAGRYRLLDALAGGPVAGVDPVRQLFLDAWEQLRGVVRESGTHGGPQDRLLRYTSFVAAGDALAALDAAAPSLGLEIP